MNKDINGNIKIPVTLKHSSKRAKRTAIILASFDRPFYKYQTYMTFKDMLDSLILELYLEEGKIPSMNTYLKGLVSWMVKEKLVVRYGGQGDKDTVYKRNHGVCNPFKEES